MGQYAVQHLKVKVIVVMGHEGCGAVKAACAPLAALDEHPTELSRLLKMVREGLDPDRVALVRDDRARDREAVVANVHHQIARLAQDKGIIEKVRKQELLVTGAFYEISSGIVDFFGELTEKTTAAEVDFLRRKSAAPAQFHLQLKSGPLAAMAAESNKKTEKMPNSKHDHYDDSVAEKEFKDDSSEDWNGEHDDDVHEEADVQAQKETEIGATGEAPCDENKKTVKLPTLLQKGTSPGRAEDDMAHSPVKVVEMIPQMPAEPKPEHGKRPHKLAALGSN